jgi:hypothetical protein
MPGRFGKGCRSRYYKKAELQGSQADKASVHNRFPVLIDGKAGKNRQKHKCSPVESIPHPEAL